MRPTNISIVTRLATVALALANPACHSNSASTQAADAPIYKPPTAAEVFELRSKCAALGEKLIENHPVGSALAHDQVSRYDPKTNRCYVELNVQPADVSKRGTDYFSRSVFDGQTSEMLVRIVNDHGKRQAYLNPNLGVFIKGSDDLYDTAIETMNRLMADDRKH
jgi:hypothetical protein